MLPRPVSALSGPPFTQLLNESQQQRYLGLHNDLGALVTAQQHDGWITLFVFTEGMREVRERLGEEAMWGGRQAMSSGMAVVASHCSSFPVVVGCFA